MCDLRVQACVKICDVIGILNQDEGNSVTIFAANPDFSGPNYAIEVAGDWTNWKAIRYGGETVLEALKKAVTDKYKGDENGR